jgi:Uncharacterized protein conserved in bacteria
MITLLFDMEVDMADTIKDNRFTIDEDGSSGYIQIADDVVSSIIGLAVTEVDGVSKLTGDITRDLVAKLGKNSLSKGVRVIFDDEENLKVYVSIEIKFGYNIVDVSRAIQEKVKQSLLTMTGLECSTVNVKISSIDFSE